jgi:hypothetical protein
MPSSLLNAPWLTNYEDIYAIGAVKSPALVEFMKLRLAGVADRLSDLSKGFGGSQVALILSIICLMGIQFRNRAQAWLDSPWAAPVGYSLLIVSLHALLTPTVSSQGALSKSLLAIVPGILIAALDGMKVIRDRFHRSVFVIALCGISFVGLHWLTAFPRKTSELIRKNNAVEILPKALKPALEQEAERIGKEIVVMTRSPWEFSEATGYRSLQIPNNDLDQILATGRKYHATHLLVANQRVALADVEKLLAPEGPFRLVTKYKNAILLRMPD